MGEQKEKTYFPMRVRYFDGTEFVAEKPQDLLKGKPFKVVEMNIKKGLDKED